MPNQVLPAALQRHVQHISAQLRPGDANLAAMFARCYTNTLDTTLQILGDGSTYVITGDIPAMWLRDSTAQVWHYLPHIREDPQLREIIASLSRKQQQYILIDPYANAFNAQASGAGHRSDQPAFSPWVWERKYETDSLCYPIRLAHRYWSLTGEGASLGDQLQPVMQTVVELWLTEQHHATSPYTFQRPDAPVPSDTLSHEGKGAPVAYTGLVWAGFRPSDDACTYGYNIPGNMFAAVTLGQIAELAQALFADAALAEEALALQAEIEAGIQQYGVIDHPEFGRMYAYEVDGLGHHLLMDDANVPSLLSAPYLGYCAAEDAVYQNTRRFVLSRANPYYVEGSCASGVGSPHTPPGYVWPIGIAMQGLTTTDPTERTQLIQMLVATTADTGWMHESFNPDRPEEFTRPWFAWANSLFAELVEKSVLEG